MTQLNRGTPLAVIGAGAMGSGIAQVAATHGHSVILFDTRSDALTNALASINKNLARSVEKGKLTADEAATIRARINTAGGGGATGDALDICHQSGLVIEAVVENLEVKQDLFSRLEMILDDAAVLATNTSSLSITAIARACKRPERVLGVHFFNPPTVLKLVEIVPGLATNPDVVTTTRSLIDAWGKTTVVASDTPGFIVNRIARPFYGEALRIYEEGIADFATIDWAMRKIGGFRMGPFELMDFIGNDINFAATKSVFEATYHDPRFRPSSTQQQLVEAGFLGRKSGRGYYDYDENAAHPEPDTNYELGEAIFRRILSMVINQAADAVYYRIASAEDIDLAMTLGVNYPKGLLQWADEIGIAETLDLLISLQTFYGEERYRPSPLLKMMVANELRFFAT